MADKVEVPNGADPPTYFESTLAEPRAAPAIGDVAKWLIPSVAALFGVVGYISEAAQESLVGFKPDGANGSEYVTSAGDFFLAVLDTFTQAASGVPGGLPLGGHGFLLLFLTVVTGAGLLISRTGVRGLAQADAAPAGSNTSGLIRRVAVAALKGWVPATLLLVVAIKFFVLDAPLTGLRDEILSPETPVASLGGQVQLKTRTCGRDDGRVFTATGTATERATDRLWCDIVCSRVGPDKAQPIGGALNPYHCPTSRGDSARQLAGAFVAQLWFAALIVVLSLTLVRSGLNSTTQVALVILALAYLLTVPHAHGKLLRSTYFDVGDVWLTSPLEGPDGVTESRLPASLVLARGSAGADLLVLHAKTCVDKPALDVRHWSLSSSQLRSIQEIERQDVIEWTTRHRRLCPPAAAHGAVTLG